MNNGTNEVKIFTYPAKVLRERAEPLHNIDEGTQELIDKMIETMYAAPGIGLAANQVGELKRLIVFDFYPGKDQKRPGVLINPEIVDLDGEDTGEEACLSVPDFSAPVRRMRRIHVCGMDRQGRPLDIEAEDLFARCLQHEIDHLNGILYIDHISSLKRSLYKKRIKKVIKRGTDPS